MKKITYVGIFLTVIFGTSESAITSWTTPTIASSADGTGTLSISESQAVSTTITTFVAVSVSTPVTYKLEPAVSPFALSTAGVLTITANLDADTTSTHTLKIVATDGASGTGTATITVTVTNVNEAPKFGSPSYKKCILDNSAIDTAVITVLATDADSGNTITHTVASGDPDDDFKIDTSTGVIQVAKALSTTKSPYTLVVNAVDNGVPSKTGSTTVTVTVSDDCSEKNSANVNCVSVVSLLICMLTLFFLILF